MGILDRQPHTYNLAKPVLCIWLFTVVTQLFSELCTVTKAVFLNSFHSAFCFYSFVCSKRLVAIPGLGWPELYPPVCSMITLFSKLQPELIKPWK